MPRPAPRPLLPLRPAVLVLVLVLLLAQQRAAAFLLGPRAPLRPPSNAAAAAAAAGASASESGSAAGPRRARRAVALTMVAQDGGQAEVEAEAVPAVEEKQQRWPRVTMWTSGAARDVDYGAVITEEGPFAYSPAEKRRAASEPKGNEPHGLRVLLMGKPSSGKGTQAPLMSRKYRMVHIATGNLLRSEIQSQTELGLIAREQMEKGELLPDELMIALVKKRVAEEDCQRCGWILDGFPRTVRQANLMHKAGIDPDVVIELDRPDEMVREWCLGRFHDAATGVIYHPKFNPPPPEVVPRLAWRTDDTPETLNRRLQVYNEQTRPIYELYKGRHHVVNSARNELEVLEDINKVLYEVGAARDPSLLQSMEAPEDTQDIPPALQSEPQPIETTGGILDVVTRCNEYDLKDYLPVYVGDEPVGYAHLDFVSELTLLQQGQGVRVEMDSYVELAPGADTPEKRTRMMADVVEALVASGVIARNKIRNELMDVRPMLSPHFKDPPLLRIERGAMIKFGVPSQGVHINGYVRNPENPFDIKIWVGKRASTKPTYPGLLDVIAAGGQPSGLTFRENAFKEAEEEASIPASLLEQNLRPAGMISYRYQTRNGLSTKLLKVFDLDLPESFIPYNGDGEVESFTLMPLAEAIESLEKELYKWKPNAALTVLDFAVRHGAIDADDEHYIEICHLLRGAFTDKRVAQGQQSKKRLFFGANQD